MVKNKWEENKLYMKKVKELLNDLFYGLFGHGDKLQKNLLCITDDKNKVTYKERYYTEYELVDIIYDYLLNEKVQMRYNLQSVKRDQHGRKDVLYLVFNINEVFLKTPLLVSFGTQYDNTLDFRLWINTYVTKEVNK